MRRFSPGIAARVSPGDAVNGKLAGLLLASATLFGPAAPALAQTLPTGGRYVAGAGSIGVAGAAMTVTQSSNRGVIDWQGFSVGAANKVTFDNGAGATLNRVTGRNLSTIAGQLSATGSVYLVNPNGVVVGAGGQVLTGGSFVASTRNVPNDQFMAGGTLTFSGSSNGTVSNAGSITSRNGDVVLIGAAASNSGTIAAPNGTAALAAGKQVLLAPAGGPAGIYVAPDATAAGDATNSGTIRAAAAALASAGGNVYALAGNRAGLIQATGTATIAGQVWLTAPNGAVNVSGTVTASNADASGGTIVANGAGVAVAAGAVLSASGTRGGTVLVGVAPGGANEAANTSIASGAQILATGAGNAGGHIETSGQSLSLGAARIDAGAGGSWVIDPVDLTIDAAAASTIDTSLNAGSDVTEQTTGGAGTGLGNINVDAAITWDSAATLTLSAFHSIYINAPITATGNGTLDVVTNNNIGGTSSGGAFYIAMGTGGVQFTTPGEGALNVNGAPFTLIWTIPELEAINNNPNGDYALAVNLDATGYTGFTPIGGLGGIFDGLGNTISNLTITSSGNGALGLFGEISRGGVAADVGLIGVSVSGGGATGALVGTNRGKVINTFADGAVTGSFGNSVTGGLVGDNVGVVRDSSASGTVSVTGDLVLGYDIGGLVGVNYGTIKQSSAASTVVANGSGGAVGGIAGHNVGTIAGASFTGAVTGGDGTWAGGVAGYSAGTIDHVRISGTVTGGDGSYVGGLVGWNHFGAVINGHVTGTVTGGSDSDVGGLAGDTDGSITGSSATGTAIAGSNSDLGGLAGLNDYYGSISGSSAKGHGSAGPGSNVGPLAGVNNGTITP